MKKWTLLVIPQGQSATSTMLNVYAIQIWCVVGLLVALTFASAFFYKRYQITQDELARAQEVTRDLQANQSSGNGAANPSLSPDELAELGRQIRAEYEARDNAITRGLSELYDLEQQVREVHGLPPRTTAAVPPPLNGNNVNGQGGAPSVFSEAPVETDEMMARPATLTYGLARPSADVMVQEINLRTESLRDLLHSMEEMQDRVARTPSIWPTNHSRAQISSGFGYRRDPFNSSVRHHDGVDFSAPHGSNVKVTGRGVVVGSEYDQYLGNVVKVDHGDGLETWYGHMHERHVDVGDQVERGDVIGLVGSTGRSTGPHIHYEVRRNGQPVDPSKFLGN